MGSCVLKMPIVPKSSAFPYENIYFTRCWHGWCCCKRPTIQSTSYKKVRMRKNNVVLLMLIMALVLSSCAAGNRAGSKGCGCPSKKGMVGY
jgi:hypothetical protein